jgi:hypothetical protein
VTAEAAAWVYLAAMAGLGAVVGYLARCLQNGGSDAW